jgi:hypothetical protein
MTRVIRLVTVAASVALLLGACRREAPPAPAAGAGATTGAATGAAPAAVSGKVLETMDSGGYTYVKLATAGGAAWAAVPKATVKVGDPVTLQNPMEMRQFHSKTLNRTFERIWFAQLGGAAAPASQATLPPGHPQIPGAADPTTMPAHPQAAAPTIDVTKIKLPKAGGPEGRTVAEVHAGRAQLQDKPVVVQGVVVKYNAGIMGKNWLHVRDGSGKTGVDDDLTVTTQDTATVGTKVVVRGTVLLDKDFGYGYKYATIVEDAKVSTMP